MPAAIFEFGNFKLDCERFELRRAGRTLPLERKPMELLILLAASNGHLVTREEIAGRLWDRAVFVDTEHGINTAIRKIRQALRDDPDQPRFIQTVTGKGYRFIGSIMDAHPSSNTSATAIAAHTALASLPGSPAGIPNPIGGSVRPLPGWRPYRARIAVIAATALLAPLIVALAMHARSSRPPSPKAAGPAITSLAVLPLDNLSGDPGQEYLADGMTDELITMLAKNSTLRVISRTSVMQYRGVHRPLPEIARRLGVDGILEGSVSRSGDRVHMTIQLIHAPTDTHIWAESYDRDANDLVTLPQEAARTIATRLHSAVPQTTPTRFVSPEAHDAYLRGQYLWYGNKLDRAQVYFRKATDLQPDYALGWSGQAEYYGAGAIEGTLDPRQSLALTEATARKAVALDPSLAQAHIVMSAAILINHWDWPEAQQEITRAIELDPRLAEAHHFYAKLLALLNRHDEAIAEQKKATELDPFARPWALVLSYILARQCDAAITEGRQRLESDPDDPEIHNELSKAYACKGMDSEFAEELAKESALSGDPASAAGIRRAFHLGGRRAVLLWQIDHLKKQSATSYVSPVDQAYLYAQLGRREQTLALLDEAFRQRAPGLLWIQNAPAFDFLHSDERYRSLVRRIGLPPAY
jgi:TolB-like protein/DNA-binding winged helix-turn-helix (wHTH) protein